ncbi:GTPase-activating protein [Komagataella phaffii CBS 7435]|uniref:Protein transport protein SEC23 n=3 Tax=Komagataella TaxID=460517 RepID=C4R8D5_KOMPG|nr:GTPase-activating protein [Komagataella phaffii GS115]ABG81277.1 Sec23p [Komagataella pastoris]AOA64956.1 GQ67_04973T0 [Komagataella phaffii]CAH2450742.1 GTPase-activating protein [Komagataella phaffii CBS 7435]AOA69531.1 GQ68_04954T0 [Komagataella phaffii GS115]CAY71860.1 GTPase-activating protein [Komagataella phaffii GS115]
MADIYEIEEIDGVRFNWNSFPVTKIESENISMPLGCLYTPLNERDYLPVAQYDPVLCRQCHAALNPYAMIDLTAKVWSCPVCSSRNTLPINYTEISTENLPLELNPQSSTIEYILSRAQPHPPPAYIYVVDLCQEQSELDSMKETLIASLPLHPPGALIGLVTFDSVVNVHDLSTRTCLKKYVFNGTKEYTSIEIQRQLGIEKSGTIPWAKQLQNPGYNAVTRFFLPVAEKDAEFQIIRAIERLEVSKWTYPQGQRPTRVTGAALSVATSLAEGSYADCACKITLFSAGPCTLGPGTIVGPELKEPIRSHNDMDKGTASHYKKSYQFYNRLAVKGSNNRKDLKDKFADPSSSTTYSVDIFAGCYDQVGIYEMRSLANLTGGVLVVTDSFQTSILKNSFFACFNKDEEGYPMTYSDGILDVLTSNRLKVSGVIGHAVSMKQNGNNISDTPIGEGLTNKWRLCSLTPKNTYAIFFDMMTVGTSDQRSSSVNEVCIQFTTTYRHTNGQMRTRVTTLKRGTSNTVPLANSFDQEAAAVLYARLIVNKIENGNEYSDLLRWIDKSLVKLCTVFGDYSKNDAGTFRLSTKFSLLPQFIYHLRRSQFLQVFNCSPDETAFYHHTILRTDIRDSLVMIQPTLTQFSADGSEPVPVLLDSASLKQDCVLLLDAFFFIVIYYGSVAAAWRDANYPREEFPGVYAMIEKAQEEAASLISDRFPLPKYVTTDEGKSQARFLYSKLNPSENDTETTGSALAGYTASAHEAIVQSDDVSLNTFFTHLSRLVVQNSS